MKKNKMFFRRIAAFITAFNFLVSVNSSMIVYADELDELFPEETDTPISTEETLKDTFMKSEQVRIIVNGTDVPEISDVIDSFFFNLTVVETEGDIAEVMIPKDMELSDMLWDMGDFEGPDYILADIDSRTYRIDGIEKSGYITDICLTEYYELNCPEGSGYSIVPADGNVSENNKYPHDTLMKVCADDGWIADDRCTFKLKGINDMQMTAAGRDYMLVINNGNEDVKIPFKKSSYYIYCPVSDKIRCVINGQESNNIKCTWLDDNKINAEFYVEDDADIKITKVYLVNSITGEKISFDQDTDGKSAFV
ncbi:MAG: hypothetical protein PUE12_11785, partial [Oscillospiraceae bacterium]|nr:hypothetical protein [Oscillospiraceae bacterium]